MQGHHANAIAHEQIEIDEIEGNTSIIEIFQIQNENEYIKIIPVRAVESKMKMNNRLNKIRVEERNGGSVKQNLKEVRKHETCQQHQTQVRKSNNKVSPQ
jgi:hypothetical protein